MGIESPVLYRHKGLHHRLRDLIILQIYPVLPCVQFGQHLTVIPVYIRILFFRKNFSAALPHNGRCLYETNSENPRTNKNASQKKHCKNPYRFLLSLFHNPVSHSFLTRKDTIVPALFQVF